MTAVYYKGAENSCYFRENDNGCMKCYAWVMTVKNKKLSLGYLCENTMNYEQLNYSAKKAN